MNNKQFWVWFGLGIAVCVGNAALVGCAGSSTAPSGATAVFAARTAYDAAFLAPAAAYNGLPRCPATPLCSNLAVVVQLRQVDATAHTLLDAAETAATSGASTASISLEAAQSAITAAEQLLAANHIGGP